MRRIIDRVLAPLEEASRREQQGNEYKPLQRKVLLFISLLFVALAIGVAVVAQGQSAAAFLPTLIFGTAGIYGLIVGFFATDGAVARLWRSSR